MIVWNDLRIIMLKRAAFQTLGCKVNSAETDVLVTAFREQGYKIVDFDEKSDVYIINTCTVTHQADSQCRQAIRRARKTSPEAILAVIGCYAQADPENITRIDGVDLVLGTRERFKILELLKNNTFFTSPIILTDIDKDPFSEEKFLSYDTTRTRAFLKVQDGCSYKCSYCIIPKVRGEAVSRDKKGVINRVHEMKDRGFKEIVLTAINLGEFENGNNYRLLDLLKDINRIPDVPRIRLTSIEPNCFTEDLVRFIADNSTICPHFHVPLQSGSDKVLGNMRRRYSTAQYAKVMNWINTYIPEAAVGADVMTGFPGETADDFKKCVRFINEMPVTYLHVFRFSPRQGTEAAEFDKTIPSNVAQERSRELIEIGRRKKEKFLDLQIGKIADVLFEENSINGGHFGFTQNYARVHCKQEKISNMCKKVELLGKNGQILEGQLVA